MFSPPKYYLRRLSKRLRPPKPLPRPPDPYAREGRREILPKLVEHQKQEVVPRDWFEHEALDLGSSSIRLIQICPTRNNDDRIRCQIRLASTDTEYTCLSYVWGEEGIDEWIYLNGKRAAVRMNLWDFLRSARQVPELSSQWLWIDALCIDQANTHERQHQVQQMGRIYAGAKQVISWLGTDRDMVTYFSESADERKDDPHGLLALSHSAYWRRAWIVQEILLGQHVRLMASIYTLPLDALPPYHVAMPVKWFYYARLQTRIVHVRKLLQHSERAGISLIYLLNCFQFQNCHIDRDRIFSLLGLCKDGSNFQVDYDISDFDLAVRVLAFCMDSFCVCAIQTVATALRLSSPSSLDAHINEFTWTTHASLTLPMTWGEGNDYMQPRDDPRNLENSAFKRHRGDICLKNDPHSIILCRPTGTTDEGMIRVTLNLRKLCSRYCGQLKINVYHNIVMIIHQAEGCKDEWKWYNGGDIALQSLDNGRICKILFSIGFFFRISELVNKEKYAYSLEETCCSRITGLENELLQDSGPSLKLSVNNQHVGEYFSLPTHADRFIYSAQIDNHRKEYE
jgi:hypothetical protein